MADLRTFMWRFVRKSRLDFSHIACRYPDSTSAWQSFGMTVVSARKAPVALLGTGSVDERKLRRAQVTYILVRSSLALQPALDNASMHRWHVGALRASGHSCDMLPALATRWYLRRGIDKQTLPCDQDGHKDKDSTSRSLPGE